MDSLRPGKGAILNTAFPGSARATSGLLPNRTVTEPIDLRKESSGLLIEGRSRPR